MKPRILHISFDYAEENIGKSTVVVRDLINETSKFADVDIISLKRVINPFRSSIINNKPNFINYSQFGLPYGIFLKSNMRRISNNLFKLQKRWWENYNSNDFIHAHKLTFEGFVGFFLAQRLNAKLIISLRQTDFYVLKYRKDLVRFSAEILKSAHRIFYIAPYMLERLEQIFGKKFFQEIIKPKLTYLPNCFDVDNFKFNPGKRDNKFLSIFWMEKKAVKRKNIKGLFNAIKLLNDPDFHLDLIGYGSFRPTIEKWIKELGIEKNVRLLGFIKNEEVSNYLANAKAFLLPSFSETFGVAYAESLLCGTPILYSKGTGFDGIFDDVGVSVNPHSVKEIALGIKNLDANNEIYRKNITELHKKNAFNIFRKESVSEIYKQVINK